MKLLRPRPDLLGTAVLLACCLGCGSNASTDGTGGSGGNGGTGGSSGNGDPAVVGTWTGTELGAGPATWTYVLAAKTMEVKSSAGEAYKGNYTLDTSVDPKRLAATITECFAAQFVGKASNGIYKIEGTTMTFAGNAPGSTAFPTSFNQDPTGATRVFTLTKQ
jgi:uncharacterized protein (TIGR03067 family)